MAMKYVEDDFVPYNCYSDKLVLRGLEFHGIHGVNEEEKKFAQPFSVDVDAWLNTEEAARTDNLDHTVSYTALHSIIKEVVEGPHFNLLEALANTIATRIFYAFDRITDLRVRVGKPDVAHRKNAAYLGVEIFRTSPFKRTSQA